MGKQYKNAETSYSGLVKNHPENFAALLGYANTFSNLKEYENALEYVNKALDVQPGNANALLSKKYIRLGYAYQLSQNQNYEKAEELLQENLSDFPGDKDILRNLANLYLMAEATDKATETYRQMAVTYNDSVEALTGMSLAAHLAEKDKTALDLAGQAVNMAEMVEDSTLVWQSRERYIQALIWNRKFGTAKQELEQAGKKYGTTNALLALQATLGMYTSDIGKSISDYKTILQNDSLSFDGNLGIANAYYANGNIKNAYRAVNQTLRIFENQKDAMQFRTKLDNSFTPFVEDKLSYSFDNGDNIAYTNQTMLFFPLSTQIRLFGGWQHRVAENRNTGKRATTNNFELGLEYQLHPKIKWIAGAGISDVNSYSNSYNNWVANMSLKMKPLKLQDLELGYKREIQNYNADLINSELSTNHYFLNFNLGTNFKLGWFSQYYYTTQSDDNSRNLLFTSVYYNILNQPILKSGINYQYIAFKNQVPLQYFSPEKYNSVEVFIDLLKDENISEVKSWFYGLTAATGYQFIEDTPKQTTYRVQLKLGYKSSNRFLVNLYGLHSNIASTTASGYNYTELGLRLKWLFLDKPVFKTR